MPLQFGYYQLIYFPVAFTNKLALSQRNLRPILLAMVYILLSNTIAGSVGRNVTQLLVPCINYFKSTRKLQSKQITLSISKPPLRFGCVIARIKLSLVMAGIRLGYSLMRMISSEVFKSTMLP